MKFLAKNTAYIKITNNLWYAIPPQGEPYHHQGAPEGENFLSIECDPRLLKKLLMGPKHAHWNNAEIGSHLTFERRGPMEFGMQLLLSYFHS